MGAIGASFALDVLFDMDARMRAFRAGGIGLVRIRACVVVRLVRTAPEVRGAGRSSGAGTLGAMSTGAGTLGALSAGAGTLGALSVGGGVAKDVAGLRVYCCRSSFAVEKDVQIRGS